jgi:hypothetical protein
MTAHHVPSLHYARIHVLDDEKLRGATMLISGPLRLKGFTFQVRL